MTFVMLYILRKKERKKEKKKKKKKKKTNLSITTFWDWRVLVY